MREVNGAGRVRRDELEVDPLAGQRLGVPVPAASGHDRAREPAEGACGKPDVEEARAGDVDLGDALGAAQPLGDHRGDVPGRQPDRLGQPQGDIGGVVPVIAVAGALNDDVDRTGR